MRRREFLKLSVAAGAGLMVPWNIAAQRALATGSPMPLQAPPQGRLLQTGVVQTLMPGTSIPQFVDPLPLLSVAGGPIKTIVADTNEIKLVMCEFQATVLPKNFVLPNGQPYTGTYVWGYRQDTAPTELQGTYIGPVIVATYNKPTQIRFVNNLGHINTGQQTDSKLRFWTNANDQTLHWADPLNGEANMCNHMSSLPATGECLLHYSGPVPAVPHLHGGYVPPEIDGGPDAWFTSDGLYKGHGYYTHPGVGVADNEAVYRYPNNQGPAATWFHDHLLGGTRLNVYAGLAGAYVQIDPSVPLPTGLHAVGLQQGASGPVDYLIPLVIQDRGFDTDGQLFMDNVGLNPEHPFWVPELVADSIVVNGKTWPYLEVEPRRYRFLFINGSNARTYEMFFTNSATKVNGPAIWQIGTDGGYLDTPVKIDPNAPKGQLQRLLLMPGERADVIVDFAGMAGARLIMKNVAKTPYPGGATPQGSTVGQLLQVRVVKPLTVAPDASYNPAAGIPLRTPMIRLADPATGKLAAGVTANKTRQLTLNEVMGMPPAPWLGGPLEILVNNTGWEGLSEPGRTQRADFTPVTLNGMTAYISELPKEGETEIWEIVNLTADSHPIHTHLVQFQLLNRQNFDVNKYNAAYAAAFPGGLYMPKYGPPLDYNTGNPRALGGNPDVTPTLKGPVQLPPRNQAGWKDTIECPPGMVTRFVVRYALTDQPVANPAPLPFDPSGTTSAGQYGYVWHCHIIDHEDNEMMRPYVVQPKEDVTRSYIQGTDY